jgi:hypothetical protein
MIPNILDNQLTDGAEIVSLTQRLRYIPREIPSTHLY